MNLIKSCASFWTQITPLQSETRAETYSVHVNILYLDPSPNSRNHPHIWSWISLIPALLSGCLSGLSSQKFVLRHIPFMSTSACRDLLYINPSPSPNPRNHPHHWPWISLSPALLSVRQPGLSSQKIVLWDIFHSCQHQHAGTFST